MATSSLMALALMLTANTSSASRSIDRFASASEKRLTKMRERAANLGSASFNNFKSAGIITAPFIAAGKAAIELETNVAGVAKVLDIDIGSKAFNNLSKHAIDISNKFGNSASYDTSRISKF